MKVFRLAAVVAFTAAWGCSGRAERLLHKTDHVALLAASRRAMASLPPPGPTIDPAVYQIDPADNRWRQLFPVLQSRTVTFSAGTNGPSVTDPWLPSDILRLEPRFVIVTPDAIHIALCAAGLSCSANAVRVGQGLGALVHIKGGEPDCRALVEGLWYCHE